MNSRARIFRCAGHHSLSRPAFFLAIVCFRWSGAYLDLGPWVEPVGAGGDDGVGGGKTTENLGRLRGADAEGHWALGSGSVRLNDQNKFIGAIRLGLYRFHGNEQGIRSRAAGNGGVDRRARLQCFLSYSQPEATPPP